MYTLVLLVYIYSINGIVTGIGELVTNIGNVVYCLSSFCIYQLNNIGLVSQSSNEQHRAMVCVHFW